MNSSDVGENFTKMLAMRRFDKGLLYGSLKPQDAYDTFAENEAEASHPAMRGDVIARLAGRGRVLLR